MFGLFSKTPEPTPVPMKGQAVIVNGQDKSLDEQINRARGRVDSLYAKMVRLSKRQATPDVVAAMAETEEALKQWNKVLKVAIFKKETFEGDAE